ncbi:MAG: hypothetical protein H6500_01315 [Candidatus Woesearchaeota archaeon]|nr:hypothetical protein [Nanoarchaeota archaeon]USN44468.1 MAG: hypothetical protein H6500_01315 [Candidatus Woesearchaeota archaeon]
MENNKKIPLEYLLLQVIASEREQNILMTPKQIYSKEGKKKIFEIERKAFRNLDDIERKKRRKRREEVLASGVNYIGRIWRISEDLRNMANNEEMILINGHPSYEHPVPMGTTGTIFENHGGFYSMKNFELGTEFSKLKKIGFISSKHCLKEGENRIIYVENLATLLKYTGLQQIRAEETIPLIKSY